MNPILKNILAIIAGLILGGVVNMGLVMVSGSIIPLPEGIDPTNMESIEENMHLFQPKHFIFPFLAHALGTLVGAFLAARIAASYNFIFAMFIGTLFFLGGISNVFMLPSPTWFNVLDLVVAYIPMAWIGYKMGNKS